MVERPVREIAERALTHLAVLPVALAQQNGGRRVPVGDGFDIHGAISAQPTEAYKRQNLDYMATLCTYPTASRESFQWLRNSAKREARPNVRQTELNADKGQTPTNTDSSMSEPDRPPIAVTEPTGRRPR